MPSSTLLRWSAPAGTLGGLLWALLPLGTVVVEVQDSQPGTLAHLASAAVYWLLAVVPLALLLVGILGLRVLHGRAHGRPGKVGFFVSFVGLALMFVGNAVEVASVTFNGSESDMGHTFFLLGFLVLLIGSVPLGIAIVRMRHDVSWRAGGLLLVAALPLGVLLAVVGGIVSPDTDLGFWAAITVPYGVAWMLLGHGLRSPDRGSAGQPARVG